MADIDKKIGLRLKISRKSAGFNTATEFSSKSDIPKSTYAQHECGSRSLTAELILQYSGILCVDPGWLLTGYGHPCPTDKNKSMRKQAIDEEILKLQEKNLLPVIAHPKILSNDNSVIVNMELFKSVLVTAFNELLSRQLSIEADELVNFCIDVYNNIDILPVPTQEKDKIIELSIRSMLSGPRIILKSIKA